MSDHHHHPGCACCSHQLWNHWQKTNNGAESTLLAIAETWLTRHVAENPRPQKEDRIFHGGVIRTLMEGDADVTVEAIAISNGEIVATGSLEDCQNALPGALLENLGARCLLPGLVEPHLHLFPTANFDSWTPLGPFQNGIEAGEADNDQYLIGDDYNMDYINDVLTNAVKALPADKTWILGFGLDPSLLQPTIQNGVPTPWTDPDKDYLDTVCKNAGRTDIRLFIMNSSGHVAYTNSNALAAAGNPANQNGILLELAQIDPVMSTALAGYKKENPDAFVHFLNNLDAIGRLAASRGVTLMWDAALGAIMQETELEVLRLFAECGVTRARLGGGLLFHSPDDWPRISGAEPAKYHSDMFNIACAKVVSDGSNQGLTGYQHEKYPNPNDVINDVYPYGVWNFPPSANVDFDDLVSHLNRRNWPVMIHANGTHAIRKTLDAYDKALNHTQDAGLRLRHRIEHASLLDETDLQNMQYLGISPSFLIGHVGYWGYAFDNKVFVDGKAKRLDRTKSATNHGLRYTLHSDHFVSPIGPLRMMEQAVTRIMEGAPGYDAQSDAGEAQVLNATECATMGEALRAATYDAAWQCHADHLCGHLAKGMRADLVILEEDPMSRRNPVGLRDIKVSQTWVDGRKVYEADGDS